MDVFRDAADGEHSGASQPPFGFSSFSPKNGVRMAEGCPLSDVEWRIKRAAAIPGPGEGQPDFGFSTLDERGGKFNGARKPKSELELCILRAAELPAPGETQPPFGFSSIVAPHRTYSALNRRQMERADAAAFRGGAKLARY